MFLINTPSLINLYYSFVSNEKEITANANKLENFEIDPTKMTQSDFQFAQSVQSLIRRFEDFYYYCSWH